MSILRLVPRTWTDAPGPQDVEIAAHPMETLNELQSMVDKLHPWNGGGLVFGRKPYLGEFKASTFRIRPLSMRRDGSSVFLNGELLKSGSKTIIRFRFELPLQFIKSLPYVSISPAVLCVVSGYLASPAVDPSGRLLPIVLVVACVIGLFIAYALIVFAMWGVRCDTKRLKEFISLFQKARSHPQEYAPNHQCYCQ